MGIKFEGQVLKFGNVDKCNRKFAPDCKITFPEKIPVAYNFDDDYGLCGLDGSAVLVEGV